MSITAAGTTVDPSASSQSGHFIRNAKILCLVHTHDLLADFMCPRRRLGRAITFLPCFVRCSLLFEH